MYSIQIKCIGMEYDVYLDLIRDLFTEFEQRKTRLNQEFADSNNPHGVGDMIKRNHESYLRSKFGYDTV